MTESKTPSTNAEQLITEHLDIWTTAIEQKSSSGRGSSKKVSLHGIKKLRELILELAVRGKLVPQDKNDTPVSDLLFEEIYDEKLAYHAKKKVRLQKFKPTVEEFFLPSIPQTWKEVYLDQVITYITDFQANGSFATLKKNVKYFEEENYALLVRLTDLRHGLSEKSSFKYTDEQGYNFLSKSSIEGGELVVANVGAGVGTTLEIPPIDKPATLAPNMFMVVLSKKISKEYFLLFSQSPIFKKYIAKVNSGTGQPKINKTEYKNCKLPYPPIEEQHRIVTKVDELMGLCDALEAQTESSITAHQTLVEVLLEALLKAPEQTATPEQATKQFQQNWQRLSEHFDTLFTTTASIDTLKETILQLAVMGKLVPQNPNDEPASVLLERIAAEKAQLVKDKKIKKPKVLPEISEDEKLFELPIGWEFVRFNDLGEWGAGSTPRRGNIEYYNGSIPWFKSGELNSDYISESEEHISELALKETSVRYNNIGDVLVAMYGATIGKTSILSVRATTNQAVCACTPFNGFKNTFLLMLLKASKSRLIGMGAGGAQPNISREKIINTVIALPPTSEQHRIVAKVDELMALCDQLKARLIDAQTTKLHLTDAIVEQAL
ncbi:MAG: restriction endonuclease [Rheinheimera sp.]|nr:restriction endonuclease [Rheinheimera sp.]|tara:strand:- start:1841 stop:3661 length:1821 start_codon:yes stop_codon:yes gene_type:complete